MPALNYQGVLRRPQGTWLRDKNIKFIKYPYQRSGDSQPALPQLTGPSKLLSDDVNAIIIIEDEKHECLSSHIPCSAHDLRWAFEGRY